MQKKLISLAIAGALAVPGAAMADVTSSDSNIHIYGKLHASYDFVDNDADVRDDDDSDDNTGVFRNSFIGFKGNEDLGNGIKAIWQVETHLSTAGDGDRDWADSDGDDNDDNSGSVNLRNTFIGLQGDKWGKIILGRHDTPYKTATGKLDIFDDTIADYNNIIGSHLSIRTVAGVLAVNDAAVAAAVAAGGATADAATMETATVASSTFNERDPRLVMYETPNFNGFTAQAARVSTQYNEDDGAEEREAWSVMGMYDQGPFFASVAYEVYSGGMDLDDLASAHSPNAAPAGYAAGDGAVNDDEEIEAWKIGLGYTFGNSQLAFVYEDIKHDNDTVDDLIGRDAFWGAFSHKFGANTVKLAYGKADDTDDIDDSGADTWSIGLDHNFSKRTKVYAIYTDMDNDSNANYGLMKDDAVSASYAPGANNAAPAGHTYANGGSDVKAFSIGIVHSF